jgi:hypothetical protein
MHFRYRLRQCRRALLIFVGGTVAVVVAGLITEAALGASGQKPQAIPPTSLPVPPWDATASPSATQAPSITASRLPSLTGPVQLVQGTQFINGTYLGWPHSTIGAVSAADELTTQMLSTLDPDRAAAVMRLAADPAYTAGPQQAAQGVTGIRQVLGLPTDGPVPAGASFTFDPVECQVRDAGADQVTVLLLADVVATLPGQGTQSGAEVFAVSLHWALGDWKLLPPPAASGYASLNAEPDSAQAAGFGWQELVPIGG